MSKDKIEVNMNVYDIPILVEQLEKANKEIEKLKERENMLQERFSDWKKEIEKERKYWLCERTGCCGRIKDSKKYSSLYQENKRLNNIINELERILQQDLENEKDTYWTNITKEDYIQFMLEKIQELKGVNK